MFPERANIGFAQLRRTRTAAPAGVRARRRADAGLRQRRLRRHGGGGRRGLVGDRARLVLDGGELEFVWPGEGPVTMTGPTAKAFAGTLDPELLDDAG